jgi:lipopolysaccharide exporter
MLFKNSVLKKSFFRDVFNLTSGYAISQVIIILFSPLLTRLYSPEEFGIFFFFITTASILSVISTGGYEKAIVVAKGEPEAKEIFRYAVILVFLVTLLAFFICLFLQFFGERLFKSRIEKAMLWLVPVYSLFFGLFRIIQNYNIRNNRFGAVSSSFIVRSSSQSLAQAGFGAAGMSSPGLIFGSCLGQIISVFSQSYKKHLFKGLFNKHNFTSAKDKAKYYADYPKYRMPSDLMNEVSIQAPVYIIKVFFSNALTGLYTFPQKILYQPSKFISQAVADVFFNKASELNNRNRSLTELTFSTYKNLFILGIIPYMILMLWGPEIFSFIFSSEWESSGKIAGYLCPWMFLVFVGSPISGIFLVDKRLRLSFNLNLILLTARIGALLTGAIIFKNAELTIILFSAVSTLYWIASIIYSLHFGGVIIRKAVIFSLAVIIAATAILLPVKLLIG